MIGGSTRIFAIDPLGLTQRLHAALMWRRSLNGISGIQTSECTLHGDRGDVEKIFLWSRACLGGVRTDHRERNLAESAGSVASL